MNITTKALVIKEQTIGESDRLVTLLSADYGLLRAFVRGAKKPKSKTASSTSLFAYSSFSLYKSRDAFVVDSAIPIEVFFDLRKDIEALAAAQYFAQLSYELCNEEEPAADMTRLILNSLHLLCKGTKNHAQIKAVFEMRSMCISGYMPDILACSNCGQYESDIMYFDWKNGKIYCQNCPKGGSISVSKNVITAVRYICLSDMSKIFSFTLSDENMQAVSLLCEKYVLSKIERRLPTLEFYKSLKGI